MTAEVRSETRLARFWRLLGHLVQMFIGVRVIAYAIGAMHGPLLGVRFSIMIAGGWTILGAVDDWLDL